MTILKSGHLYELNSMEGTVKQQIQFIEKEIYHDEQYGDTIAGVTRKFRTVQDGTTNEEVLLMMIDRLKTLNKKVPSRETSIAITKIEEALHWLYARTLDRENRGVKGTPNS